MANIFVYGGICVAAGALPNRRAPNLTRISCLSQEDERLATRLNEQQLRQLFQYGGQSKNSVKTRFETEVKLSIGLKLDFSVQI